MNVNPTKISPRKRYLRQEKDLSGKRNKFNGVVAAAVDAQGPDYGRTFTLLDLHRLVHSMESNPAPASKTWREIQMRAELCQQMISHSPVADAVLKDDKIRTRVEAVCLKAAQIAAELKANDATEDPVQKIFFPKTGTADAASAFSPLQPSLPNDSLAKTTRATKSTAPPTTSTVPNIRQQPPTIRSATKTLPSPPLTATITNSTVSELQQEQRAQVEAAVASMAAQMKDQTARLHSQLRGQTEHLLSDMETTVEHNVAAVTDVAAATQRHVRASWRRTFGTWTALLTIMAAFVGTVITIVTIPKGGRRGAQSTWWVQQRPPHTATPSQFCRTLPSGRQECFDVPPEHPQEKPTVEIPAVPIPIFTDAQEIGEIQHSSEVPINTEIEEEIVNHEPQRSMVVELEEPVGTFVANDDMPHHDDIDLDPGDSIPEQQQEQKPHPTVDDALIETADGGDEVESASTITPDLIEVDYDGRETANHGLESTTQEVHEPLASFHADDGVAVVDTASTKEAIPHIEDDNDYSKTANHDDGSSTTGPEEPPTTSNDSNAHDVGAETVEAFAATPPHVMEIEHNDGLNIPGDHDSVLTDTDDPTEPHDIADPMLEQVEPPVDEAAVGMESVVETSINMPQHNDIDNDVITSHESLPIETKDAEERPLEDYAGNDGSLEADTTSTHDDAEYTDMDAETAAAVRAQEEAANFDIEAEEGNDVHGGDVLGDSDVDDFESDHVEGEYIEDADEDEDEDAGNQDESPKHFSFQYSDAARAASTNDLHQLLVYVEENPNLIFETDQNGWGLLHESARIGATEIVRLLLEYECDVSLRTTGGLTALDLAVSTLGEDHPTVVLLQEAMGYSDEGDTADENEEVDCEVGMDGECIKIQHINVPSDADMMLEEALREFDNMRNAATRQATTAPQRVDVGDDMFAHSSAGDAADLPPPEPKPPLNSKPMFEGKPFSGMDLRKAASKGDYALVQGYLDANPSFIDQFDQNGWTALHLSTRGGFIEIVQLLLEAGSDVHKPTRNGRTVLDLALSQFGEGSPMADLIEEYIAKF